LLHKNISQHGEIPCAGHVKVVCVRKDVASLQKKRQRCQNSMYARRATAIQVLQDVVKGVPIVSPSGTLLWWRHSCKDRMFLGLIVLFFLREATFEKHLKRCDALTVHACRPQCVIDFQSQTFLDMTGSCFGRAS